jgi:ribosomal protein S18 acetylase RimI-like enzyme
VAGLPFRRTSSTRECVIEPMTLDDAARLRLSFWTRFDETSLVETLRTYPGRSVWMPETSEYALVRPWRHRPEIASIAELSAMRHPSELAGAAERRALGLGANLVLMVEVEESRRPAFYKGIGFNLLEEVVTYELAKIPDLAGASRLKFTRADIENPVDLRELLEIDHASFPWVWWNEPAEFQEYADAPGVEIFIGRYDGRPVSYLGMTAYLGWGHIDRVAVIPELQGQGLGTDAVRFTLRRLVTSGATRIGLSTQRGNLASQKVYERLGFRRAITSDYRLYGKILLRPPGVTNMFSNQ